MTIEISSTEHRSKRRWPARQEWTPRVPTPCGPRRTATVMTTYEGRALPQLREHHTMHGTTETSRPPRCRQRDHILCCRNTLSDLILCWIDCYVNHLCCTDITKKKYTLYEKLDHYLFFHLHVRKWPQKPPIFCLPCGNLLVSFTAFCKGLSGKKCER